MEELQALLEPGFTAQEALEVLLGNRDNEIFPDLIYIEPPPPAVLTDEDSDDENDLSDLRHLSGRQLLSGAEIVFSTGERISSTQDAVRQTPALSHPNPSSSTVNVGHRSKVKSSSSTAYPSCTNAKTTEWIKNRLSKKIQPVWIRGDLVEVPRFFPVEKSSCMNFQSSSVEIFEKFFNDEIVDLLVHESQKYARFLNSDYKTSKDEMKCFVAILFLTGYNPVPSERHLWSEQSDLCNEAAINAMRKNRYLAIKRFIHCADNALFDPSCNDKLWKMRPLINIVKRNLMKNFVPRQNLDYDEAMIRYFGRHGCKQFLKGKPMRYGYKVWSINSSDGYLVNFEIYQGKSVSSSEDHVKAFGACAAPFVSMLDEFSKEKKELAYNFYFDNLFTGVNLFRFLKDHGYTATGTIRENRIPKKCIIENKKLFKKKIRGTCDFAIEKKDGILFVNFLDNSVVTLALTVFGVKPYHPTKRYSKQQKKNVTVNLPMVAKKYNEGMGGTDLMDRFINQYRIGVSGKKWWWPMFTWLLDVMMVNAWIMYKRDNDISQLDFRREVVLSYLAKYGEPRVKTGPGKSVTSKSVLDTIRLDTVNHLIIATPDKKKKRCAMIGCTSIIRTMCKKCKVGLCIPCFEPFHTK